jgi:hypothetical protein
MNDAQLNKVLEEIKAEQQISPYFSDDILKNYIKEAEYDINNAVGKIVDYEEDLEARSLLKNYVLYANHKRLAEFKELYRGEYAELQIKYNRDTDVS